MVQRIRTYALKSDKKSLFRAVTVLLGVILGGQQASGYGSTSAVDMKQFTPLAELNKFWLHLANDLSSNTGFETATKGKVGVGGNWSQSGSGDFASHTLFAVKGNVDLSNTGSKFDTSIYVGGWMKLQNAVFANANAAGVVRIDGALNISSNTFKDYTETWVGGDVFLNSTNLYNKFHMSSSGNRVLMVSGATSNSSFEYNNNVAANYTEAKKITGASIAAATAVSYSPPDPIVYTGSPILWYSGSQMPGYNLNLPSDASGFISNAGDKNFWDCNSALLLGGATCTDYPGIANTGSAPAMTGTKVTPKTASVLPPGYYGNLTLNGGIFYLDEGFYYFNKITLDNSAKLIASQPTGGRTIVYSKNGLSASSAGGSFIGPDKGYVASSYGIVDDGTHQQFGGGSFMFIVGDGANATFDYKSNDSYIWATISAPRGKVNIDGNQIHLYGQIFADNMNGNNNFKGGAGDYIAFYPDKPVLNFDVSVFQGQAFEPKGSSVGDNTKTAIVSLPLTMSHVNNVNVYVYYHTEDVTALTTGTSLKGELDYRAVPPTLPLASRRVMIPAGTTTGKIDITVYSDGYYEGGASAAPEKFKVVIDKVEFADFDPTKNVGYGSIIDQDDPPGHVHVNALDPVSDTLIRSNKDVKTFAYTVSLSNMTDDKSLVAVSDVVVPLKLATSNTAVLNADFVPRSENGKVTVASNGSMTVTIPTGASAVTIYVDVPVTSLFTESLKFTYGIDCGGVKGSQCGDNDLSLTSTILGIPVKLSLAGGSTTTNALSPDPVNMVASLVSNETGNPVTTSVDIPFTWSTTNGTALAGIHYVKVPAGTASKIPAKSGSVTLPVTALQNLLYDQTRNFTATVVPTSGAGLPVIVNDPATATGTLLNGWPKLTIAAAPVTVTRKTSNQTISVPVTLSRKTTYATVAYKYHTANGNGVADSDYVAVTNGVGNAAATNGQTDVINLTIKGASASLFDTTRYFKVVIDTWDPNLVSGPTSLGSDTALITIKPLVTSANLVVDDATADLTKDASITFPVRLVDGSDAALTTRIPLPFTASTTNNTAKAGTHFVAAATSDFIFPANTTGTSTFPVSLIKATKFDITRDFKLDLAGKAWYAKTLHDEAVGTLSNSIAKPKLSLWDTTVVRPGANGESKKEYKLVRASLDHASAIPLAFDWATSSGSATEGADFIGVSDAGKGWTIGGGDGKDTLWLPLTILSRGNEYDTLRRFTVSASIPASETNLSVDRSPATVKILPRLGAPYLVIMPASVEEGAEGETPSMTFTVQLRDSTGASMTTRVGGSFAWATQDSATTSALNSNAKIWTATTNVYNSGLYHPDFTAGSGSVTVAPGAGSGTFSVSIRGNDDLQKNRLLSVRLSSPDSLRLGDAVGLGTILDDDGISSRAYFLVAKDTAPETQGIAWVPVRIKKPATQVDTLKITINARTTAKAGENFVLKQPTSPRDSVSPGDSTDVVRIVVQPTDTLFWIPVQIKHDSVRTKDLSLILDLAVSLGDYLSADPGRSQTELVIANTDPMPYLGFRDTVASVDRGTSAKLPVGIRSTASDLDPSAQYNGRLRQVDTASALPVWSALVATAATGSTPSFAGRIKDATLDLSTLNDGRSGPAVQAVLKLSNWNEAVQPSGAQNLYDSIVVTVGSTPHSKVAFFKDTLKVNDVDGQATIKLLLDRSSWWKTGASVVPTATPKDVNFKTDSSVALAFAPIDSIASFVLTFGNDHKVGANREFDLHLSALYNLDAGKDSVLHVVILNTNLPPQVRITSPADSARLGKKDLDSAGKVLVRWSLDGTVQTPYDTALSEGWNTITKCATDEWGNVGCNSIAVNLDTTAPVVTITAISKDSGKTWIAVGPTDTPWVNKTVVKVKWTSVDAGVTSVHEDFETLKDSISTVKRCIEDAVGNQGCGSHLVGLDLTPPKVWIVTPPVGSHWSSSCVQTTWYEQDAAKIVRHDTVFCFNTVGAVNVTVYSSPDRAGNVGTATNLIYIDPNTPSSATYVDTDGDGRVDAVVVQYPRAWTDSLPTFDISYGGAGQNTVASGSVTYGTAGQSGTKMVYNGDTIRVVTGTPVLDASGNPVVQADGTPLYQSSTGTPLLDATGKQMVDSNGVPLWKVTTSSTAVDSLVLVVKLATPFPYGWTSSALTDLGVMHAVVNTIDSTGKVVKVKVTDTFDIKDGVAPVILESRVIRTEDYNGKDTLIVQLSEVANVTKDGGTGILEISKDGGKTWIAVNAESVSSTGTVKIVLEPGQDGNPSPGVLIRIAGSVTDASGNTSSSSTSPAVTVLGPKRPDLVQVTAPSTLLEVPANWGAQKVTGTFTFLTSNTDSNSLQAYRPGVGYTASGSVSDVCPDIKLCAAFDLYVNRPSNTQLFIYDQVGTYVAKVVFSITSADLAMIKRDKLDRARLRILWNLRDEKGSQVVSGVYLVRTVIRYTDVQDVGSKFDNFVIHYGVKVK